MKIYDFITEYSEGTVNVTDEISYDIYDVIKQTERMKHRKYKNPKFSDGMKKLAYNLGHIMKYTLHRSTDMDCQNLNLHSQNQKAIKASLFFKALMKAKLKDENFDTTMNEDRSRLIDGHLMTKEVNGVTKHVNLLNIVRPWHIMDLEQSGLAEKTFPNSDEIEANRDKWDNFEKVEELIEQIKKIGGRIVVYEHWKEDKFKVNGQEKQTKGCVKYLDCRALQESDSKQPEDWEPYVELQRFATPVTRKGSLKELKDLRKRGVIGKNEDRVPCYPYKERRLFTLEGRALGVGVWELLANLIEHYNENWNNKRRFDQLANKGLLIFKKGKKPSDSLTQEFVNNASRGAFLEIERDEDIQRFDLGNITIDHLATVEKLFELARQTMGITAPMLLDPKASKTATAAHYDNQNAKTTYAMIIEEMGLYYQELFRDFKIPTIIEEIEEGDVKLLGTKEELEEMEEPFIENLINIAVPIAPVAHEQSEFPRDEHERLKQAIRVVRAQQGDIRFGELKKHLLKLFDYDIEFYANNNSFDKIQTLEALNEMILDARSNPMSKYSADKLMEYKMELLNANPKRFKKTQEEIQQAILLMQQNARNNQGSVGENKNLQAA
jgi:hypothetical protein